MSVNYMIANMYTTIASVLFSNIVPFRSPDVRFFLYEISTWKKKNSSESFRQPAGLTGELNWDFNFQKLWLANQPAWFTFTFTVRQEAHWQCPFSNVLKKVRPHLLKFWSCFIQSVWYFTIDLSHIKPHDT